MSREAEQIAEAHAAYKQSLGSPRETEALAYLELVVRQVRQATEKRRKP